MTEIPEDIRTIAKQIANDYSPARIADSIAAALMAERVSATERERERLLEALKPIGVRIPDIVWCSFQDAYEDTRELHPREGNEALYDGLRAALNTFIAAIREGTP